MTPSTNILAAALSAASLASDPSGAATPGFGGERVAVEETIDCAMSAATPDGAAPLSSSQIEALVLGMAQSGHARAATDAWAGLRGFADATTRRRVESALGAHQPLYLKWQLFLDSLPQHDARITSDHVEVTRALLTSAADGERRLPAATTDINEDGSLSLAWTSSDHYLDFNVYPDGQFSWFYRDRQVRTHAGSNGALVEEISPELREILWQFLI